MATVKRMAKGGTDSTGVRVRAAAPKKAAAKRAAPAKVLKATRKVVAKKVAKKVAAKKVAKKVAAKKVAKKVAEKGVRDNS